MARLCEAELGKARLGMAGRGEAWRGKAFMKVAKIVEAIGLIDKEVSGLREENKRLKRELERSSNIIRKLNARNLELQNYISEIRSVK